MYSGIGQWDNGITGERNFQFTVSTANALGNQWPQPTHHSQLWADGDGFEIIWIEEFYDLLFIASITVRMATNE